MAWDAAWAFGFSGLRAWWWAMLGMGGLMPGQLGLLEAGLARRIPQALLSPG